MTKRFALLIAALSIFISGQAVSQELIDGRDPQAILNIARGYGSATLSTDSQGDPKIEGRIGGKEYLVLFYDCTDNRDCRAIQLWAWFNTKNYTHANMAEWNQNERFGKAYLDTDGDPNIEWEVNLFGGVTHKNLDDNFDWWRLVLEKFGKFVGKG